MSVLLSDTSPGAAQVLLWHLCGASAWRKLEMVRQLNRSVHVIVTAGLCLRYPEPPGPSCSDVLPRCCWAPTWPPGLSARHDGSRSPRAHCQPGRTRYS